MLEVTTPPPHVKSCYPPKSHQHRIPTALCPVWNHPKARPVLLSQPYFPRESCSVSPAVGPSQTPTRSLPALGIWEGSRNAVWPWERPMRPPPAGGCAREGSIRIQPRCWVTQEAVVPLLGVCGAVTSAQPPLGTIRALAVGRSGHRTLTPPKCGFATPLAPGWL